jgi:uncharacterized damage-inducible protein DinB
MFEREYLDESLAQLRKLKAQAEKAIAQIDDTQLFALIDAEANSIAIIMKHMAGSMRSRWTDFLTTDGEKPDRNRDSEFERDPADTRAQILERWEDAWRRTFDAISSLGSDDLLGTVTVRNQPHTVLQAIGRQMAHYAGHVGQIILLAKHFAGPQWQTLSMPKKR